MRRRDSRLWAVVIAVAFLALWCAGVNTAYGAPAQEPAAEPLPVLPSQEIQMIGILGWCLVAIGFLGVALCAFWSAKPRRRRKGARGFRPPRHNPIYSPTPASRYIRSVDRRR